MVADGFPSASISCAVDKGGSPTPALTKIGSLAFNLAFAVLLPISADGRCQNINQHHVKDWVRIFSRPSSLVLAGT
jgi:hypothetical protein